MNMLILVVWKRSHTTRENWRFVNKALSTEQLSFRDAQRFLEYCLRNTF